MNNILETSYLYLFSVAIVKCIKAEPTIRNYEKATELLVKYTPEAFIAGILILDEAQKRKARITFGFTEK